MTYEHVPNMLRCYAMLDVQKASLLIYALCTYFNVPNTIRLLGCYKMLYIQNVSEIIAKV